MPKSSLEINALAFAKHAHKDQKRKYTNEPYIVHPVQVAKYVKSVTNDSASIAAALLHDVVEDTSYTYEDILINFGKEVADLVEMLTDVSTPEDGNRAARKLIDKNHTALASPKAKTIKLADLLSNIPSVIKYDPDFAKVYLKEKKALLEVLVEGDTILYLHVKDIINNYYKTS